MSSLPLPGSDAALAYGFDAFSIGYADGDGVSIAYRKGGTGNATLLIHGWPMTGYEWRSVAAELAKERQVIVPDYRGAGSSSVPDAGYTSMSMADDMAMLLDELDIEVADVVGHDIGMQVAVALALRHPDRVRSLVAMESMIPGMSAYDAFVSSGEAWHFKFNATGEMATELTHGREARFFEHFYEDFTGRPERIGRSDRDFYAQAFASRDRLRAGYRIYEAFDDDGRWFQEQLKDGLPMPCAVICGSEATGAFAPRIAHDLGTDTIRVLDGIGHFIPEEGPDVLLAELRAFWASIKTS